MATGQLTRESVLAFLVQSDKPCSAGWVAIGVSGGWTDDGVSKAGSILGALRRDGLADRRRGERGQPPTWTAIGKAAKP